MTTEMSFEVMEKVLPHVVEIVADEKLTAIRDAYKAKTMPVYEAMGKMLPIIKNDHYAAVIAIVAGVSGKSAEQVAKQDFNETVKVFAGGFVEEVFGFFASVMRMVLKA